MFAMGLGAGALAAGAAIFGDDFISGFDVPTLVSHYQQILLSDYQYLYHVFLNNKTTSLNKNFI